MNIQITGHHMVVTQALRDHIEEKFKRLENHCDHITRLHVTLSVQKVEHKAEATLHIPHQDIHGAAVSGDMYQAVDQLLDKMDKQLLKYKEKKNAEH